MPAFLITSDENNPELEKKITEAYPEDHYVLTGNQWLISAETTTKDLAEKLNIYGGGVGRALVFSVDNYSGYYKKSLWEWLKLD